VRKPAAAPRGIVASQHQLAAEVGAGMLGAGGNAVDAAVAAGFALAAIERGTAASAVSAICSSTSRGGPRRGGRLGPVSPRALDPPLSP